MEEGGVRVRGQGGRQLLAAGDPLAARVEEGEGPARVEEVGGVFSPPAPRVKEGGCALPLAARAPLAARVKEGRAPPGLRRERTKPVLSRRGSRRVGALCRLLPGLCCLRRLKK